ncbi:hypothetical protein EC957_008953 [Mortierella hygrophila]|uniref:Uncharacterized protein n=1 Tax=Mortierella hygrophila TaxID=979708 RepID=A0A9P6FBT3_9FUNG|nr:hypothetical protein EC957_008953 [Mortierella hygrophila]
MSLKGPEETDCRTLEGEWGNFTLKFGIDLLGLIAAVASALPTGDISAFPTGHTTRYAVQLNADCISATLTWAAQDGYQNEIWLEAPNYYSGHVGKHRYAYLEIDSDDKAFRVLHFDGPKDERMVLVYKGKSYSHETKNDGSANGDKFIYYCYYCLDVN